MAMTTITACRTISRGLLPVFLLDLSRSQKRDHRFGEPALQTRTERERYVRRAAEPHDRGREARTIDLPRRRLAPPPRGAGGVGDRARGVERAGGRLRQSSRLFQDVQ